MVLPCWWTELSFLDFDEVGFHWEALQLLEFLEERMLETHPYHRQEVQIHRLLERHRAIADGHLAGWDYHEVE